MPLSSVIRKFVGKQICRKSMSRSNMRHNSGLTAAPQFFRKVFGENKAVAGLYHFEKGGSFTLPLRQDKRSYVS